MLDYHSGALATLPPELTAVYAAVSPLLTTATAAPAAGFGIPHSSLLVVFSFLTQSTSDVMAFVNTNAVAGASTGIIQIGTTGTLVGGTSPDLANVYQGVFSVPYYQSQSAPTSGRWLTGTGAEVTSYSILAAAGPAATATLNIPVMISTPKTVKPGTGWPTIIFQHGITGDRTNMLGLADGAAAAGYAVIAIDQPLHGLGTTHPLRIAGAERTFDLDVSNNATRAPGADGITDTSGQNYINLSSLLTSRDNLRQSAADLIRVAKSIAAIDYDGGGGGDFDASQVHFVGHSLGAIVGTTFLAVNTDVQAASLGMPGGTIARLLRDSPTFSVSINNGLAANGVIAGTQLYEQFMQAAQTVVDSGDPINFATAANANHSLHLIQVVGTSPATQDQVVPNSATARLITALGLAKRSAVGANAPDGYVNFTAGDHSSLLSPAGSAAAFTEMQTQVGNFMGSNGAAIVITNAAVIEP
jgi:pimeloyl-ACP methyl ester carboxylesterase